MESRAAALGLSLEGLFGSHPAPKAASRAPCGTRKAAGGQVAAKYRDKDGHECGPAAVARRAGWPRPRRPVPAGMTS